MSTRRGYARHSGPGPRRGAWTNCGGPDGCCWTCVGGGFCPYTLQQATARNTRIETTLPSHSSHGWFLFLSWSMLASQDLRSLLHDVARCQCRAPASPTALALGCLLYGLRVRLSK